MVGCGFLPNNTADHFVSGEEKKSFVTLTTGQTLGLRALVKLRLHHALELPLWQNFQQS